MKKVGIITFHASHNYGSMLQAYALQQVVLSLGHECEIINFRTKAQKKFYLPFFLHEGWAIKLKAIRYPRLAIDSIRKYWNFENFLKEKYTLSLRTYATSEELKEDVLDYDCYISGSDQIWNTSCCDFRTSYFLDFVIKGKRIAYAPSMGHMPFMQTSPQMYSFIKKSLLCYNNVSVREQDAAMLLKQTMGITSQIVLDPTLLINPQIWLTMAGDKPLINEDYILVYTPRYDDYKQLFVIAAEIAEKCNLKIICTLPDNVSKWRKNIRFKYYTAVGPIEFLNLIKFSKYVFCGSFHAVVFSIVFGKPFYAFEGMSDSRISPLLKIVGLEHCADIPKKSLIIYDEMATKKKLEPYINQSIQFLENAINN